MDRPDHEPTAATRAWRSVRLIGLNVAVVFLVGTAIGLAAIPIRYDDGLSSHFFVVAAVFAALAAGCAWLLVRELRKATGDDPLTPQEKRNRNLLIASGVLGGATALIVSLGETGGAARATADGPLQPIVALAVVLLVGVALPAIGILWHRNVDEQEADAYKTGALYGMYVYMIGAPVWWFAWRGGFVPAPDGIAIYFMTITAVGIVWLWKKYG